ncbi:MAG: hypothetical protein QM754_09135 [Tepidisphaeraceae bacterium]
MAGTGISAGSATAYDEIQAKAGRAFPQGDLLMSDFLGVKAK